MSGTDSRGLDVDKAGLMLFTGNAHRKLAEDVAHRLGVPLGKALVGHFSDGEVQVEIEENVRRQEVFVLQPTGAPSAENLMELLVLTDALKRASAVSVTAVMPYFGYARQDRRPRSTRVPITAKLAACMIDAAGVDRVLTVDLHADQIQGFFDIPVDNVYASPVLLADIWRRHSMEDLIVVSPDVGGVVRARAIAKRLDDADLAIIDKRRPKANVATVMNIIGDVEGKDCVLVDDIVDTAGTLCAAAAALKERGAKSVEAYCVHPVLSGKAIDNINGSALDRLVVTDTLPLSEPARACGKIRQLTVAELLAETIRRIAFGESVSSLYVD
ncbi:MAG TPA: ribose-phosphate diphosphokinase [Oleiagrimonas sp.]|nr:ribose-phosphate diphosphokinase [Oleiagrimonas sp.]